LEEATRKTGGEGSEESDGAEVIEVTVALKQPKCRCKWAAPKKIEDLAVHFSSSDYEGLSAWVEALHRVTIMIQQGTVEQQALTEVMQVLLADVCQQTQIMHEQTCILSEVQDALGSRDLHARGLMVEASGSGVLQSPVDGPPTSTEGNRGEAEK
jgi:hypothetical protein